MSALRRQTPNILPPKNRHCVAHRLRCGPLSKSPKSNPEIAAGEELCLACGLCCNGAIFADVQLLSGDNAERLAELGLAVRFSGSHRPRFAQPCVAHDGCRCRIYSERPSYCRQFDCALLKRCSGGRLAKKAALEIISTARERVALVKKLLRDLGDTEVNLSLGVRFRRTAKRLERSGPDESKADLFSQLTLAIHDLNRIVAEEFYPGNRHPLA